MRTGGPRTQKPTHPGPRTQKPRSAAQNSCHRGFAKSAFFQGDRIFKSWSPWVRGPPARMSSPFTAPFNLKAALCRGMRTGGPRTQHPAPRTLKPRSSAQNSCHWGSVQPFARTIVAFVWATRPKICRRCTAIGMTLQKPWDRWADYCAGEITFGEFDASVKGWVNHVSFADTWGLRKKVLGRGLVFRRPQK